LDIGCGTGDNAIWLSQKNFHVLGIDASEIAIEKAKEKALKANVKCTFIVIDILTSHVEGAPFGFAFVFKRRRVCPQIQRKSRMRT
jgi:2-polyprenyl-3-methyl-5-hydroxy-6-metoxy-1,4-benzoquinol methylase